MLEKVEIQLMEIRIRSETDDKEKIKCAKNGRTDPENGKERKNRAQNANGEPINGSKRKIPRFQMTCRLEFVKNAWRIDERLVQQPNPNGT